MSEKPLSIFLDLEFKETPEYGISKKVAKRIRKIPYIVCPVCGLNRPLRKTGSYYIHNAKGKSEALSNIIKRLETGEKIKSQRSRKYNPHKQVRFDLYDLENGPFISIREPQGKTKGIREIEIIRLKDYKKLHEDDKLIIKQLVYQLREQCKKILTFTEFIK